MLQRGLSFFYLAVSLLPNEIRGLAFGIPHHGRPYRRPLPLITAQMSTHPPNKRKRDDLEDIFSDSSTPAATPKKRRQRRRRSSNRHHQDARAQASASYSSSASGSADESQGKKGKRRAAGWGHEDGAAKRVSGSPLEPENKSAALAPKAEDVADPEQGLSELERLRHQVKQKDALLQEYDQFARLVQSHVVRMLLDLAM